MSDSFDDVIEPVQRRALVLNESENYKEAAPRGFSIQCVVRVFSTGEPRAIEYLIKRGWKIISDRKTPKGWEPHYSFGWTKASDLRAAEVDMTEARRLTTLGRKYGRARLLLSFLRQVLRSILHPS